MAEKRITTVDEVTTVDESADYILIVRGTQKDLRRLLIRRFPQDFDIHDDVADELTTLAGGDRLVISDEGSPGAPQKFVNLSTLRSFFLDLFDLHDDVPVELTEAAEEDRLLISDEDEPGDPQKFITVENLGKAIPAVAYEILPTEYNHGENILASDVNHNLGRPPVFVFPVLVCKVADQGYSVGDLLHMNHWVSMTNNNHAFIGSGLGILAASNSAVTIAFSATNRNSVQHIPLLNKTTGALSPGNSSRWKVRFLVAG